MKFEQNRGNHQTGTLESPPTSEPTGRNLGTAPKSPSKDDSDTYTATVLQSFLNETIEAQDLPRYFGEIECRYCRKPGHKFRNCPDKSIKCNLCQDEHDPLRCPLQEVCFLCWKRGHMKMNCPGGRPPRKVCLKCDTKDHHTTMDCTNVWRDYVSTKGSFEKFDVYCYYCGDAGHFGDFCTERRQSIYQPSAFDYDRNDVIYWKSKIEQPKNFAIERKTKGKPSPVSKTKYDDKRPKPRYKGGYNH